MTTPLLDAPTLVVEQRRKLFELRNQYRLFDEAGSQIGAVEQETQSAMAFLTRLASDLDVVLPVTLNVLDSTGNAVLILHKPWFSMRLSVSRVDGTQLGSISKRVRVGKARFTISEADGSDLGEVRAQNWRAKDFAVLDTTGNEVAQVAKQWRGIFTDADTYVVQLTPTTAEPLRSLALGACLAIDLVMKQKDY